MHELLPLHTSKNAQQHSPSRLPSSNLKSAVHIFMPL